jgi:hypothetical protein
MRRIRIITVLYIFTIQLSAQDIMKSYSYSDGYAVLPKMLLERKNDIVIPFSITKNKEKKAGVLYMNKDNSIKDAILFEGKDNYVINEIIESKNGNLLVSAEGYSEEGQESLYFIELDENGIINDFVFNENGNELDPFAILEIGENILIGGFIKKRELISNSFYNMYSEKQMIYVAEFTKNGKKIWSKGFDLVGYEKGICNQMIKQDNGIVLLCHANKIGEQMAPILINIDFKGNVKNIVEVGISNNIVIGSRIVNINNQTKLVGSYMNDVSYLFNYLFNENLKVIETSEYIMPGRILINSFDENTIVGSIFKDKTYNNLVINFTNNSCIINEFGSDKTDMLIGKAGKSFFGYKIGNVNDVISSMMIFNNIDSSLLIDKQKSNLFINDNIEYNIEKKFIKSSINKGIEKVKILNVLDRFISL